MARNKLKRFLAGLCTAAMLMQTAGESGMTVFAAGNEETVEETEETVSDDKADDPVSEDGAKGSVSAGEAGTGSETDNTVSEDDLDRQDDVSSNNTETECGSEQDKESDVDVEEYYDTQNKRLIKDGKVYDDVNGDGVLDTGETLIGSFDIDTGELIIDANLEYVPSFLLNGWKDLKSVSFGEKGVDPGAKASTLGHNTSNNGAAGGVFNGCTALEKVDLSNAPKLTTIKMYAFNGCSSLKEVNLNDELQYIEQNAFVGCDISEIKFGSSLISIGNSAFENCKSLKDISLSSATTTCGTSVFKGCAIESFTLAKDDKGTVVFPNNLFNNATFKSGAVIDIGADTVEISSGAFQSSNIAHVKLSSKLTAINSNAFNGCVSLKEIDFSPCAETLSKIGASAFSGCTSIKVLNLPDKITRLGNSSFYGCAGLVELKLSAGTQTESSLGTSIFARCSSLKSVEFPEGHEYVGVSEFQECISLTEIKFSSTIKKIGDNAFMKCSAIIEVELPENDGFTVIPNGCFQECSKLEKCDLREGIKEVGNNAFYVCNRFMSVLPTTLTKIGNDAFNSCGFCGTLTLAENLNYIGGGAFKSNRDQWGLRGRQELSTIKILSKKLEQCGTGIFNGCSLREVELEGVTVIPANLFNQATWITDKTIIIDKDVEVIGDGAFAGNNSTTQNAGNLEKIDFSECINLKKIGKEAFAYNSVLVDFTLPDSVEVIGDKAFSKCAKLHRMVIPENVTTMGTSVFEGCSLMEEVAFNAKAVTQSGKNIFKDCNLKNITIGSKVTILPDYLFEGARFQKNDKGDYEMVSLTLPASVEKIGISSLTNVVNLKELKFETGSVLKKIGQSALSGCKGLEAIELPETVTIIDNYAFQDCSSLTGIDLPQKLSTLGIGAFKGCEKITRVVIPSGVSEVKKESFFGCSELNDLSFAEGSALTAINESAFTDCKKLAEIKLPESIKTISSYVFSACPIAGEVKLPEGFTSLGQNAFSAAGKEGATRGKTTFYLPKSLKSIGNTAFKQANAAYLEFYVVAGSYAEKWLKDNGFGDCIVGSSAEAEKIVVTFDLQGHGSLIAAVKLVKGDKLVKPEDPTEEGWLFGGWFTEKACKTAYNFDKEVTKDFTLYAKWTRNAENVTGGESAMDSTPSINAATTDLWVVKGQKFYLGDGWSVSDKTSKKYVSISKGVFKAKKENGSAVVKIHHDSRANDIVIHISKPSVDKKLTLTITDANNTAVGKIGLNKDPKITKVLWYSASPDVATVDGEGNVKAVGKGKAKITAYINGVAYTCNVTVKEKVAAANRTMHLNLNASKAIKVSGVKGAWSVVSGNAASMNSKGNKVTAGSAAGTAILQNGAYTIDVYVEDITVNGATKVKTNKYTINLTEGNSTEISLDSVDQAVIFKSSKPEVAYYDEIKGSVVAKSKGTSKLTAKINGKTVTITVKVQ